MLFLVYSCTNFVEGCAGGDKAITGQVWFVLICSIVNSNDNI